MKDTFKVVLATKQEIPNNMPLYMMPSIPDEARCLMVDGKEVLYFRGSLGAYVAGEVRSFCIDNMVAEVSPIGDMEKGKVEDLLKTYGDTKVTFTNPGYSLF